MNRQEKFPLTYGLMKSIHEKSTPKIKKTIWFGLISRTVEPTNIQRNNHLKRKVAEVDQPIWRLVEDILLGKCEFGEATEGKEDTHIITVGKQEFLICKIYHMFVETCIAPNVTTNSTEHQLLSIAFQQEIDYEENGKYRDKLMEYYEEKV
jgi:hypothetical protein